jgi:hypothetical protein
MERAIRRPGTIGVDVVKPETIKAVRSHLPPEFRKKSERRITEYIRRAIHNTDESVYPSSSDEEEISRRKRPRRRADHPLSTEQKKSYDDSPSRTSSPKRGKGIGR